MKLSTKGRYGLKAMLDLALHDSEGIIALKNIAERQDISENYLEQLLATLRKARLIKSVRGSQGGYMLAQSLDEITVGNILRALEGSLAPTDCVTEIDPQECSRSEGCVTRLIWERIRDSINEVVDSITLQDLVNDFRKLNNSTDYIYYI
jgi:Rrf2 family transcriptional regulator, cysteine metabolism repressor